MIPIAKPVIGDDEIQAVAEVLKSGMLAQGEVVERFEKDYAEYIGVENAIAVSNGTIALDLALKALDIKPDDEIITTPFSFIATANSVLFQGAKPVFADVDDRTFNINPNEVLEKITDRTRAVIGVHLFGHPFEVKAIEEICKEHNLFLIEDCAQAHGAEYESKRVGSFGIGCFSFYPTKNMTTGEGGIITITGGNSGIAGICRLLRNHGESEKYLHTVLGYNYRMTNIQAAIGRVQLRNLAEFNEKRRKNAGYLNRHLKIEGLVTPSYKDNEEKIKHVYHQYVIRIEEDFPVSRDAFMEYLKDKGVGCAVHYPMPIYRQPFYQRLGHRDQECPIAEELAKRVLSLPVHPALKEKDLKYIVDVINNLEV
ncbi:MAG: DegT/DnrJ/EryC1/StrS family aminotransferase [Methanophagales archaeon]|nr:DegT/DnrJ/EryC1/StrS family aminotransferase [Methanophagales archaeon]